MLKPESVPWELIHDVIWQSHEENRRKGVVMRYPSLSGEDIKKKLGMDGRMLVALTGEGKLVGTAAVMPKEASFWFGKKKVAYCCFASILPEYNGKGIYKEMCLIQERIANDAGLAIMMFDTHEKNTRILNHSQKAGYRFVDYKYFKNHFNVVLVKWLDGCPYSRFRCFFNYHIRRIKVKLSSLFYAR